MASRQNSWTSNTSSVRKSSREKRECKVSGCKKLHCYVRTDEKKIYSQYCQSREFIHASPRVK